MKFPFGMCDCMIDSDAGKCDFDCTSDSDAHVRSHVSPGMDCESMTEKTGEWKAWTDG